ncbi:hypothetical protein MNBD_GAMMA09-945 [hydrothermal vent metagenome]|uniref:Uncharacterized protein n=1 Tax=hydrothermal vent metagenome TaxID=652676 RepID=A0A3B0X8G8_9ZZZZ
MNSLYNAPLIKFLLLCVFIIQPPCVYAHKVKALTLQQLAAQSDIVALVEIEASREIKKEKFSCGFEYTARAVNILKGKTDERFKFGYMQGLQPGRQYLIFLVDSRSFLYVNINVFKEYPGLMALIECKKIQPEKYTLAQGGSAFFEIETSSIFDHRPVISIERQHLKVSKGMKYVNDRHNTSLIWITLDDALGAVNEPALR